MTHASVSKRFYILAFFVLQLLYILIIICQEDNVSVFTCLTFQGNLNSVSFSDGTQNKSSGFAPRYSESKFTTESYSSLLSEEMI